jgi:hypothetical protein
LFKNYLTKINSRNDPIKTIKDPVTGKSIKIHEHVAGDVILKII